MASLQRKKKERPPLIVTVNLSLYAESELHGVVYISFPYTCKMTIIQPVMAALLFSKINPLLLLIIIIKNSHWPSVCTK